MKSSAKQVKTPGNAQKSPYSEKGNGCDSLCKRQRIGRNIFGVKLKSESKMRICQAFSVLSTGQEPADPNNNENPGASSSGYIDLVSKEFSQENVQALLNIGIRGKTKFDYKSTLLPLQPYF